MSDYKLVPTELTDEMVDASGCEGYFKMSPHEHAQEMWAAMLAAAPAINIVATKNEQGQIVCVTLQDEDQHILQVIAEAAVQSEPVAWINGETLQGITGDQGRRFQQCWLNHHRTDEDDTPLYAAPQPVEQQPDVSQLVEALSALRGCIMETRGPDAHSALVLADAALAAYRKGGDVP